MARNKIYRAEHIDEYKERDRIYAASHKEEKAAYNKIWTANNKEHLIEYKKMQSLESKLLTYAKRRAKVKCLDFTLTLEDIIIPEICPILLIPLFPGEGKVCSNSPSIDRVNDSKGYTKDNIRVISHGANNLKRNADIPTIERLLKYMKGEL